MLIGLHKIVAKGPRDHRSKIRKKAYATHNQSNHTVNKVPMQCNLNLFFSLSSNELLAFCCCAEVKISHQLLGR